MLTLRKSDERGHIDHGWLNAMHTFSFGHYRDPEWMGFRTLRVINEDRIAPRMGFSEHGHRDMEIITYPLSGTIRHRDSLGNSEDITPGMIQRMTAGSGIRHSESNPLDEETHLLQIWIEPRELGLAPSHGSRRFPIAEETGRLHTLVSPDGRGGSLVIQQDAVMSAGVFHAGDSLDLDLRADRHAWIHVVRGSVQLDGHTLGAGDSIGISESAGLSLLFGEESEILVFDLA
ncbi:MAG: pirin family protein [Phycisphaerales bacterium]|nr:pirin family protein [Phycisphaerales bacterium]